MIKKFKNALLFLILLQSNNIIACFCYSNEIEEGIVQDIELTLTEHNFYTKMHNRSEDALLKEFVPLIENLNSFQEEFIYARSYYADSFIKLYMYNLNKSKKKKHRKYISRVIVYLIKNMENDFFF